MGKKWKPAAVFSDHMVLQRDVDIRVFGESEENRAVSVSLNGNRCEAAPENGRWQAILPPLPAGGPYVMEITDGIHRSVYRDVMVGEVWLAGGQSNMELELQNCRNGKQEVADSAHPLIRFYNTPKIGCADEKLEEAETASAWKVCGPETSATMSAVAYFFACRVQKDLGVAVGILDCYVGGTSISCWMSERQLARTAAGQKYLDQYAAEVGDKTDEQYEAEMDAYWKEWNAWDARVKAARAKDPDVKWEVLNVTCGACPWPQPAGKKSLFRPAGIYSTMLRRVCPYTVRGFLYYQGEEDDPRCADYREMLAYLIDQWRSDWGNDELPFLLVQLPRFISKTDFDKGEDNRHWCVLREAQWRVSRTVRGVFIAVTVDCGEFDNIHPLDKQTVGTRLALQALAHVYGRAVTADGPSFLRARTENGRVRVWFAPHGELCLRTMPHTGFELAGADGVYFLAEAEVENGTILLRAAQVPAPRRVRYAWFSWGDVTLFNTTGLPAAPFRGSCS